MSAPDDDGVSRPRFAEITLAAGFVRSGAIDA
jgi:hypothetical protein